MLDLERCRKDAKALACAFRGGERDAIARAEAVLGARTLERFVLADAQHVVAVERGFGTWRELKAAAETRSEQLLDSGLEYVPGEPVRVRMVRRGRRVALSDEGRAVALAEAPPGWWEPLERMVREEYWINLSRTGEVFVPVVDTGELFDELVHRVAEASLAVYRELLEWEDD